LVRGTGFFWAKANTLDGAAGAVLLDGIDGIAQFRGVNFDDPKPAANAKRWDSPEGASYFNFNLVAMDVSVDSWCEWGRNWSLRTPAKLIELLFEHLPKDRYVLASPTDAARRGTYGCFAARSREKTAEVYQHLRKKMLLVSLARGNIRVSPHLYNTERDIDRLISVVTP